MATQSGIIFSLGSSGVLLAACLLVLPSAFADQSGVAPAVVSCKCAEIACGPCESEAGLEFYTAKCGTEGARVKSCKRPRCEAVDNQKQCLALLHLPPRAPGDVESEISAAKKPGREPASIVAGLNYAGAIERMDGTVTLVHAKGGGGIAHINQTIHNGDRLETKNDAKVKIRLKDHSEMTVAANSSVAIEDVQVNEATGRRNVLISVLRGKVRNKVEKKYEGENSFVVKTKTTVAGVRGTDFVASFEPGQKEWVSEIQTLTGQVHFENVVLPGHEKASKTIEVAAGTSTSFVIGPPTTDAKTDAEMNEALASSIDRGFFSPNLAMKPEETDAIHESTEFPIAEPRAAKVSVDRQSSADNSETICQSPAGQFNQCSFTCEGNPKGEKRCRVDRKGVNCVRRICRASGAWVEPTRLPASERSQCTTANSVVQACGEYW